MSQLTYHHVELVPVKIVDLFLQLPALPLKLVDQTRKAVNLERGEEGVLDGPDQVPQRALNAQQSSIILRDVVYVQPLPEFIWNDEHIAQALVGHKLCVGVNGREDAEDVGHGLVEPVNKPLTCNVEGGIVSRGQRLRKRLLNTADQLEYLPP